MSDLDQLLRETLQQEVPTADSQSIVDAVRQRVAAGDPGVSAGARGPFGGGRSLLPWFGAGALAVVVGGTVGFVGFGTQEASAEVPVVVQAAVGTDCPDGSPVVNFRSGERVLAVVRDADASHLGVRSPFDRSQIVWVQADRVTLDDGTQSASELPEQDCIDGQVSALPADGQTATPEPTDTVPTTTPTSPGPGSATDDPDPDPEPMPNEAPRVTSVKVSRTPNCGSVDAVIEAAATDDHQVTEVALKWSGADAHDWVAMSYSGGTWKYTYLPPSGVYGNVTFTVRAYDAQGRSNAKSITQHVECLI